LTQIQDRFNTKRTNITSTAEYVTNTTSNFRGKDKNQNSKNNFSRILSKLIEYQLVNSSVLGKDLVNCLNKLIFFTIILIFTIIGTSLKYDFLLSSFIFLPVKQLF
jgi:hypothetical protein